MLIFRMDIEIGGRTKKNDRNIKIVKDYSYWKRLKKLGLTFVTGLGDRGSIPKTQKMVFDASLLTLCIISYRSRVSGVIHEKE